MNVGFKQNAALISSLFYVSRSSLYFRAVVLVTTAVAWALGMAGPIAPSVVALAAALARALAAVLPPQWPHGLPVLWRTTIVSVPEQQTSETVR